MSVVSRTSRQKSWQIAHEIVSLLDDVDLDKEDFAAKLRALARAEGLDSDEDAARKIKVSYRQYQRWLAGESEARASSLKKITSAYDIPLTELLGEPDKSQLDRIAADVAEIKRLLSGEGSAWQQAIEDLIAQVRAEAGSPPKTDTDRPESPPAA